MKTRIVLPVEDRGAITLPTEMRQRHHLHEPGAQVEVIERSDGVIELHPQPSVAGEQSWFWDERWQQGERRVDAHVDAGEITVSDDIDAFLADLDAVRQRSG